MAKLITVIVPIYRIKEEFLRHCLDSLMNQDSDRYKVILVDDGSPDNCGKICDEYAAKSNVFQVIHQNNAGVSAARNAGIDAADTEWITFADPDDWLDNGAINEEIKAIELAEKADIVLFDYLREYDGFSKLDTLGINSGYIKGDLIGALKNAPFYKLIQDGKANPFSVNAIWNKIYRRRFLEENSMRFIPEAKKGQDRLFNADAFGVSMNYYYYNKCLYHYRCNEESVSNRFNPKIVDLTKIEINELVKTAYKHNLSVQKLLNARICTRLYSCMRLYYFHADNPASYTASINEIKILVNEEPFKTAIAAVEIGQLSEQEGLFVICLKLKLYRICKVLVSIRARRFGGRLIK